MPKLGLHYPWQLGAYKIVPNTAPAATGYANLRSGDYFQADVAHRLLSQANNQKLPIYPTLPAVFDMALVADNYTVGMRGTALDAADNVRAWVSERGPWLRTNRLLRRPRTLLVTSAFDPAIFGPVASALDGAWDAINTGGWEAAVIKEGLRPAWTNFPDPFYLGLPVRSHDGTAAPTGDFAGAFGELVLAHVCLYSDLTTQNEASPFPHFVSIDSTQAGDNLVTVGSGAFTDSLGSHTWALQRNALWHAAGPAFFTEVLQNYARFRMVVVNGNYGGSSPMTTKGLGIQAAEAAFPAETLLRDFTGLDSATLTVIEEPFDPSGTGWSARAGATLAAWLADNLNG